jgi:hypothetical protein
MDACNYFDIYFDEEIKDEGYRVLGSLHSILRKAKRLEHSKKSSLESLDEKIDAGWRIRWLDANERHLAWKLLCFWGVTLFFLVFGEYILHKDNSLLVGMFLPDMISLVTELLPGIVLFVKRLFLLRRLYLYADKCLICHEKHGACDRVITDCGHVYGGSCLEPWIQV